MAATHPPRIIVPDWAAYQRVCLSRRKLITSVVAFPFCAKSSPQKLKILVAGGHPGDPECGCGGTMALCSAHEHDVVVLYLNRGEGYCGGASLDRCATIRTAEAETACRRLRARAVFAGQYDGQAVVDPRRYQDFARIVEEENPHVMLTQWPIDRHRDHRAVSLLSLDAWLRGGRKFALYYYEVAEDTMMFSPNDYVDISSVEAQRRAACYAHASQQPDKWYPKQVELTRRRGAASGFAQAEGFLRHPESPPASLP